MSMKLSFLQRPTLVKEIESAVKKDERPSNVIDEGEIHQLNQLDRFSTKTFDSLLDDGWGYVNISILCEKIRSNITSKYSETPIFHISGTENQEQWFQWKAITGREYIGSKGSRSDVGTCDFSHHLGISGLSFIVQKMSNNHELLSSLNLDETTFNIKLKNATRKSANAYRLTFWNSNQRGMVSGNDRIVVFHQGSDTGKHKRLKCYNNYIQNNCY